MTTFLKHAFGHAPFQLLGMVLNALFTEFWERWERIDVKSLLISFHGQAQAHSRTGSALLHCAPEVYVTVRCSKKVFL